MHISSFPQIQTSFFQPTLHVSFFYWNFFFFSRTVGITFLQFDILNDRSIYQTILNFIHYSHLANLGLLNTLCFLLAFTTLSTKLWLQFNKTTNLSCSLFFQPHNRFIFEYTRWLAHCFKLCYKTFFLQPFPCLTDFILPQLHKRQNAMWQILHFQHPVGISSCTIWKL